MKASLTVSTSVPQMAPRFESVQKEQKARQAEFAANRAAMETQAHRSQMLDNIAFGKSVATRLNTQA